MESKQNMYPDAPPMYEGSEPATAPPVVVMQQPPQQQNLLGSRPTMATCPSCNQRRVTNVEFKSSSKTHLIAVILLATTCCCCIPYMVDSCKSAEHLCSNCGAYLGTYKN